MKAISIYPKWADMIRLRLKSLEIRTWPTKHRGELLICSTKPDGHARCVADLVNCRPMTRDDVVAAGGVPYADGLWAWELANVREIEPFPVKGLQRIFNVEPPKRRSRCSPTAVG